MANIELRHLDMSSYSYIKAEVKQLYSKSVVKIEMYNSFRNETNTIILDKSTAIRFAKTLLTEINKIQ